MAWLGDRSRGARRRLDGGTRATDEAGRLLEDAVGRYFCLDVLERRVEALRIFKAFVHVQHADAAPAEVGGHLAVDRPADAVLDIQRLVQGVDIGRAEGLEPVFIRDAEAVRAEACEAPRRRRRRRRTDAARALMPQPFWNCGGGPGAGPRKSEHLRVHAR